jgi:hypothetical protein
MHFDPLAQSEFVEQNDDCWQPAAVREATATATARTGLQRSSDESSGVERTINLASLRRQGAVYVNVPKFSVKPVQEFR